jgi:hypothetical protein
VLNPIFITNFDPFGNILLEKNRTTTDKVSSSFNEVRYLERIFTFSIVLVVAPILSQISAKNEK